MLDALSFCVPGKRREGADLLAGRNVLVLNQLRLPELVTGGLLRHLPQIEELLKERLEGDNVTGFWLYT